MKDRKKRPKFVGKLLLFVVLCCAIVYSYYFDDFRLLFLLLKCPGGFSMATFLFKWGLILVGIVGVIITIFELRLKYKQFWQSQEEFRVKNYYKHKDEFIKHIENALDSINLRKRLKYTEFLDGDPYEYEVDDNDLRPTKYHIGLFFDSCFGHDKNLPIELRNDIIPQIKELYNFYIENVDSFKVGSSEFNEKFAPFLNAIGLTGIEPVNIDSFQNRQALRIMFTITKSFLEFVNQSVENGQEVYDKIRIG